MLYTTSLLSPVKDHRRIGSLFDLPSTKYVSGNLSSQPRLQSEKTLSPPTNQHSRRIRPSVSAFFTSNSPSSTTYRASGIDKTASLTASTPRLPNDNSRASKSSSICLGGSYRSLTKQNQPGSRNSVYCCLPSRHSSSSYGSVTTALLRDQYHLEPTIVTNQSRVTINTGGFKSREDYEDVKSDDTLRPHLWYSTNSSNDHPLYQQSHLHSCEDSSLGGGTNWPTLPYVDQRIVLNISGLRFETRASILDRHPTTLLGDPVKREAYFHPIHNDYFFDRHRPSFEAIFNYYQHGGRIKRPLAVDDDVFLGELEFFQLESDAIVLYKKHEGYVDDHTMLPESRVKRHIWLLFEYPETSKLAYIISAASVLLTIVSIILFCVETIPTFKDTHCVKDIRPNFADTFFILETICTFWFTVEISFRFFSCPKKYIFIKDCNNWIDLIAIAPYYITLTTVLITMSCEGAKGSARLAFLRATRLIRVLKLTKHSSGLQVLVLTFKESIEGLGLFLVAFIVCILVFSSALYYAELDVDGSQIESIPAAFWWAVITMCTVGYGDTVPKSSWGRLVGSVCAVAGVLTLAIPVPIITENFNKFYLHKIGRGKR